MKEIGTKNGYTISWNPPGDEGNKLGEVLVGGVPAGRAEDEQNALRIGFLFIDLYRSAAENERRDNRPSGKDYNYYDDEE